MDGQLVQKPARRRVAVNSVNQYVARIKDKYRAAGRLTTSSRVALFKEVARDGLISYYE